MEWGKRRRRRGIEGQETQRGKQMQLISKELLTVADGRMAFMHSLCQSGCGEIQYNKKKSSLRGLLDLLFSFRANWRAG